ncbi:MAG: DUF2461 family protein, partial [Ruminiclostridium sp.]|nr:DUF2461 family protein [Ruminiclostridium sp.]
MFKGFSKKTTDFLKGIRDNNNKEWFEAHKEDYQKEVYEPLCGLAKTMAEQFSDIPDVVSKASRIYQDASYPPYLHYRDTMWIYILHNANVWNQTPMVYLELSATGIVCGFKISKPQGYVMENFRKELLTDKGFFFGILDKLKAKYDLKIAGEEYKRKKPCEDEQLKEYINRKTLYIYFTIPAKQTYTAQLGDRLKEAAEDFFELVDYFMPFLIKELPAEIPVATDTKEQKLKTDSSPIADKYGGFMW